MGARSPDTARPRPGPVPRQRSSKRDVARYQIDSSFDVAGISELAHRERSAFKPVYSMNRWWARRSSAVFRAILLGLLDQQPAANARELYVNANERYPEASSQIVLDPFMGGGTTVVEALRIGYRTIGIDLNPLAWFIVRNECTAVDLGALDAAFERVRENAAAKIQALYSTTCPHCKSDAQVVHAFWSKLAACTTCNEEVEMRRDWIVGRRRNAATVEYVSAHCDSCSAVVHVERGQASVTYVAGSNLQAAGGPLHVRYDDADRVVCPSCGKKGSLQYKDGSKKKVDLFAIQCPRCRECLTERGPIRNKVECPHCSFLFEPAECNTERGMFSCSTGHRTSISEAARLQPRPLDFRLYAIEGYCTSCRDRRDPDAAIAGYRFFKKPDDADLEIYRTAERSWERLSGELPWPKGAIRNYEKTNRLVVHNYSNWWQLFNSRQLLSLGYILQAIKAERDQALREALTAAFLGTLEHQNMLNIYYLPYAQSAGGFGRHDFHPKVNACEGNPWGADKGRGTFTLCYKTVREGKQYLLDPFEPQFSDGTRRRIATGERVTPRLVDKFQDVTQNGSAALLTSGDSRRLSELPTASIDHVVTDPPYADAVQYSELADFFYVWLREALGSEFPTMFVAEETPKEAELVENVSRGHSQDDFHAGLTDVFRECHRVLKESGRLIFTFHHSRQSQWEQLHRVIVDAGFELIASYPVASEGTRSGNLVFHTNRESIAYDIIHVCQKRSKVTQVTAQWSAVKRDVEERARVAVAAILEDVDHGQRIGTADVAVIVWSEVVGAYSRYCDRIKLGSSRRMLPIREALDDSADVISRTHDYAASINPSSNGSAALTSL